jgi:hypothetical protein
MSESGFRRESKKEKVDLPTAVYILQLAPPHGILTVVRTTEGVEGGGGMTLLRISAPERPADIQRHLRLDPGLDQDEFSPGLDTDPDGFRPARSYADLLVPAGSSAVSKGRGGGMETVLILEVDSVSVSVVDQTPEELLLVSLEGLTLEHRTQQDSRLKSGGRRTLKLQVADAQVDDMRAFTAFPVMLAKVQVRNFQGTFREHSVHIQGIFSAHSGNIQCTFREYSVHIQGTFRESSVYIQGTFSVS